jgi:hypothetical protein
MLVAVAIVVVLASLVAWRAMRDEEGATVVVDDGTDVVDTTLPPPTTFDSIDSESEVLEKFRRQVAAAGLDADTTVDIVNGLIVVDVPGVGQFVPVAAGETEMWMSKATSEAVDPVASYRNCVEATGDPDAAPCADMKAASNPDLSGRVWLGDEQVRAAPLHRLDALGGPPEAYFTAAHVIAADKATDPEMLERLAACDAAMRDVNRQQSFPRGDPPSNPPACAIAGVIR